MVPSPERQQQYARTMKVEADRLGHLVENVLRFARLEQRSLATRKVPTTVEALFERFLGRLHERAEQAGMKLSVEMDDAARSRSIATDPQTIEQIVFNLIDNACKYATNATDKTIHLVVRSNGRADSTALPQSAISNHPASILITVRDHGPGIDARMSKRLFTAFSKSDQDAAETAQGVGLGLALCRRMAADLGGRLVWDKSYSAGASFTLTLS
jgi:signal transduction histidine kinase